MINGDVPNLISPPSVSRFPPRCSKATLGKRIINPIKKRRKKKGLTQANLAPLLNITQIYVSQFETGGLVPSKNQTKKIAEIPGLNEETFNKELSQFY